VIDYGYAKPGFGDTLQAVRGHAYDDPLAHPGEADLTAHVDFAALAATAREAGAQVMPVATQGDFLRALGLEQRAAALARGKAAEVRTAVEAAVDPPAGPRGAASEGQVASRSSLEERVALLELEIEQLRRDIAGLQRR
jgi:NADH dehydrogenase [ubiquinone] 1 alpha subcomplex assembly factor 7